MPEPDLTKNLTKVVAHKCHLCSKKILCDIYVVRNHLTTSHQRQTINNYCKINDLEYESKYGKPISQKQYFELYQGESSDQYKISEKISNQCMFSCKKCDYSCNRWPLMTSHITKKSHGPIKSSTKYVTKAIFHKCKICEELMLCDYVIVSKHLKIHQMTALQYKTLNHTPNAQGLLKEYKLKLKSIIQNNKDDCIKLSETMGPKNNQDIQKVTKHVGNISFFQCHVCNQSDFSYTCLKRHYWKKHKLKKKMSFKSHFEEACYHRCHICSAILLCDNTIVGRHAKGRHNMKFSEYRKHVVKNGGKVFPTFNEYRVNNQVLEPFMTDTNVVWSNEDKEEDSGLILPGMISSESEATDEE